MLSLRISVSRATAFPVPSLVKAVFVGHDREITLDNQHQAVDSLSVTIQPIPYPTSSPHNKSISLHFRDKDFVQDSIQGFTQVQVGAVSHSSLIHHSCNTVIEGHSVCQARFALGGGMWAVIKHLSVFHVP